MGAAFPRVCWSTGRLAELGDGGIQTPGCIVILYEDASSWKDGLGWLPATKRAPELYNALGPESCLPAQGVASPRTFCPSEITHWGEAPPRRHPPWLPGPLSHNSGKILPFCSILTKTIYPVGFLEQASLPEKECAP